MDAKIPPKQSSVNTIKAITMLFIRNGYCSSVIWVLPIKMLKMTVAIPMLSIMPRLLIVPIAPEAIPKKRFSTELIMALVLGDEKKAKPKPSTMRQPMMYPSDVPRSRRVSRKSPNVVIIIPNVATIRGSIRSEILPAKGETQAIIMG